MTPPRGLREETAEAVVWLVERLGADASFRRVLLESRRRGRVRWHRTLRRYLDLLLLGKVLEKRLRDVGSVYPMELYRVKSSSPRIHVGLSVLRLHGLNWEIEEPDIAEVSSDLGALVRAKPTRLASRQILAGCLEDCIAYEFSRDARTKGGTVELLAGIIATMRLDLAYLFKRADRIGIGRSLRALFRRVRETFSSAKTEADARVFLAAREVFLKLARNYSTSGTMRLAEERGQGREGIDLVRGLSEVAIVNAAGKQLGILG